MQGSFFFVPQVTSTGSKRQKELIYSASKSHAARRAHSKRRNNVLDLTKTSVGAISNAQVISKSKSSTENAPNAKATNTDAVVRNSIVGYLGDQDDLKCSSAPRTLSICGFDSFLPLTTDLLPQLNRTVDFVQLHVRQSWSPSFMLRRLTHEPPHSKPVTEPAVASLIPTWLWHLWSTDGGVYRSSIIAAIPLLSRIMPVREQKSLQKMAWQLKAESLRSVREKVRYSSESEYPWLLLIYHVKALFREASLCGDVVAATYHAHILGSLTDGLLRSSTDAKSYFRLANWSDAVPALFQMRRPVIQYSSWMPKIVAALWREAQSMLPSTEEVNLKLPPCILSPSLCAAFLFTRKALYISNEIVLDKRNDLAEHAELLLLWIVTKSDFHICELLNLYHDLIDLNVDYNLSIGERYMEASLALALLHVLQKSFGDLVQPNGVDLHESAVGIRPALLHTIQQARTYCSQSERLFYHEAESWIIFVGACAEERLWMSESAFHAQIGENQRLDAWFHVELSQNAASKEVMKWKASREAFRQFVLNESIEPRPQTWYDKAMATVPT